jgi:hypothetical protein
MNPLISRRAAAFSWLPFLPPEHFTIGGIRFRVIRKGASARRYIHVHGNETTARDLLLDHMRATGKGKAFLVESLDRNVDLGALLIDPNRMFSTEGAGRNLRRVNRMPAEAHIQNALRYLERDRDRFIRRILPPKGGLLIALHNNGPGYSVETEIPISTATHLPDRENPREFMLCTDPADFALFQKSPFNVVLQPGNPPPDDGSLSRVCAARGIRYVNIEAAQGQYDRQRQMLGWIESNLP